MQTWNAIIIKVLTASTEGYDMNDSADRWRREQPPYLSTACAYTCVCVRLYNRINSGHRPIKLTPPAPPRSPQGLVTQTLPWVTDCARALPSACKPDKALRPADTSSQPPTPLQEVVRGNLDSAVDRGSRWLRLSSTTHLGRTTSLTLAF